jgi:predicted DCC family thiol-disulfide oxidoreductase YuxK
VSAVLLFDGTCGFCARSVRLILRHDRRGTLRFAALQGAHGTALRSRHPELAGIDSMVWVEPATPGNPERVWVRSAAALKIAGYLGGLWQLARAAGVLPRALLEWAYDLIARHRHQLPGALDACFVPSPEIRARFLD